MVRCKPIDADLAQSLYATESDPDGNAYADDVELLLTTLHRAGMRVAIVSDIHFDIRPSFAARGWIDLVDAWVLSFEVGAAKPDPTVFAAALSALDVDASVTLMVGDRAGFDGAAEQLGITTLLLPPLRETGDCRLQRVLDLAIPGWRRSPANRTDDSPLRPAKL
jgi:FMN phosphatase YigB (HAD superfamily)